MRGDGDGKAGETQTRNNYDITEWVYKAGRVVKCTSFDAVATSSIAI